MATVADLVVNLSANSTNLNVGLTKGRRDVKQFANSVKQDLGGAFNGLAPAVQSVTYAVDDFVAGFSTGGFAGGIRGAGNNISQLGMQIGGVWGLLGGVGITLGFTIFDKVMKWSADSAKSIDDLTQKLQTLKTSSFEATPLVALEPSVTDIQQGAAELSSDAATKRLREIESQITQREANTGGLIGNQRMFGEERAKLAQSLANELGIADLTRAEDIKAALLAGRVNSGKLGPGVADIFDPMAGFALGGIAGKAQETTMSADQRKRLELLLELTKTTNEAEKAATENIRALELLQTERQAIDARLKEDSQQFLGKPTDQTDMFSLLLPSTRNLRPAFTMPGMAQEGTQLGDLNQSIRDKFDEKPSGTPSTGFAPAAEQGSMEAARIILGAMGNNRTMEIQKQQLDAQKAAVKEIQKLGVTMKTTTKPLVVEDLVA
jgi:hypothetical protein